MKLDSANGHSATLERPRKTVVRELPPGCSAVPSDTYRELKEVEQSWSKVYQTVRDRSGKSPADFRTPAEFVLAYMAELERRAEVRSRNEATPQD